VQIFHGMRSLYELCKNVKRKPLSEHLQQQHEHALW